MSRYNKVSKINIKDYMFLHAVLLMYSLISLLSKVAANEPFMSIKFIVLYTGIIGILFTYALLWQQVLKRFQLTTAFANKSMVIVWGMIWGNIFFMENISCNMIIGTGIIFYGVYYMVVSGNE